MTTGRPACPACSAPLTGSGSFCSACGARVDSSAVPTRLESARPPGMPTGSDPLSDTLPGGRFVPGTMLAGRYRIVGMLGRGGMGEVYRADDLKLGQPVALKLLPTALAGDPGRLARFHNEVRLARQVSHPSVCRVYDMAEADGQHFLSMEYVDGEDLSSLLRRIGRLPQDKAVEIARQLCAGLAAAHDRSVLHRDLKPANIMLDGRGRVRIMDFGLAALTGGVQGDEARAGTPEYMAPEQLAGGLVTARTDIYALGLVLYEIFTGRQPYRADSLPGLLRARRESTPASPTSIIAGLDPAVERVIMRSLETEPSRRPASAMAVAAALPGGDPLAAALAAGETPSPEMVAAAGEEGGLKPAAAWGLLGWVAAGLIFFAVASSARRISNFVPLDRPPEVLEDRARSLARTLGHAPPASGDSKWGFDFNKEYLQHIRRTDTSAGRWDALASGRPPAIYFWYRQSPASLIATGTFAVVTQTDPANDVPGMAQLQLDPEGRLLSLVAVPPAHASTQETARDPDWSALLDAAGLNEGWLAPSEPVHTPAVFADRRAAWEGTPPELPGLKVRVEAGAFHGTPVFFRIYGPWASRESVGPEPVSWVEWLGQNLITLLFIAAMAGGLFLVRHNLKLGRGDRTGAFRLALVFVVIHLIVWALWVDHVADLQGAWGNFTRDTGWTLFNATLLWIFYVGLEPYVRRRWPETMISWSRLLGGGVRDPLVGRDLLIGCALGTVVLQLAVLARYLPGWIGLPPPQPDLFKAGYLEGIRWAVAEIMDGHVHAVLNMMQALLVLMVLRMILRLDWLAGACFVLLFSLVGAGEEEYMMVVWPISIALVLVFVLAVFRFGILTASAAFFTFELLESAPLTTHLSVWYAAGPMLSLFAVAALAAWGFYLAVAGRPLFAGLGIEALQE
ncbi:MAG TPA: serine/threonine-protein kinase [Candidatus Polarisedimenticolia bacterium]|nr:serine/threonine-protein kinase [Candidatus Polarisedimenticolia bacterium]